MRRLNLAALILLCLVLATACSLHPKPQGPGGAIALISNDMTAMVEATTAAYKGGLISKEHTQNLFTEFKEVERYLLLAADAHATGHYDGADAWIDQAVKLLNLIAEEVPQ